MVLKNHKPHQLSFVRLMLWAILCMAVFSGMPTSHAQDNAATLTLQESLARSYNNNPTLQAARAEYRAVQERLPQAFAGFKPDISAGAGISNTDLDGSNFGGGSNTTTRDISLSLAQPIYRGGQTIAEVAAAKAVIASQKASLIQTEQTILLQGATAYMDVLRDQAVLELSMNNRDVIATQKEATQERFNVGELTKTDTSQAEARLARAQADIIRARGDLRKSKAIFEQIIGIPAIGLVDPKLSQYVIPKDLDDSLITAENQNPQILAVTYAHAAAEKDVDDVFAELLPNINLSGELNRSFDPVPGLIDKQTTKSIGLTASIPLYQSGATRSRVRQAKYTANQRQIQIKEAQRQTRQDTISAWESLQTAEAEIKSRIAETTAAAIASEGVTAENEFGSRTVLDALDAEQEYLDAQVALVIAERERVVSTFTLLSILGALTPQSLGLQNTNFDYKSPRIGQEFDFFDLDVDRIGDSP